MNPGGRPRSTLAALCALLVIVAGLLLRAPAIATAFAADEEIRRPATLGLILAARCLLLAAGVALLLFRRFPRWLPGAARGLAVLGAAGAAGLGLWVSARRAEWIQPRIHGLEELCGWLSDPRVPYFSTARADMLARRVRETGMFPEAGSQLAELQRNLANELLRAGRVGEAIRVLREALDLATSRRLPLPVVIGLHRGLGIAYLRSGEVRHCVDSTNAERCLFPIRAGGVWSDPAGALRAIEEFSFVLENGPEDPGVRWLLNIAHMVAGTWPEGVSPRWLIPPETFAAAAESPGFREVGAALGVGPTGLAGGALLEDLDDDGFLDIVVTSNQPCAPLRYYRSRGDGTFESRAGEAGLGGQLGGFNLNQTDSDNDGRLDLYVIRGAWLRAWGRQRNSLLRQNPDGTFTDVTERAGLADQAYPNITAEWADFDGDGDLDLYVGGEILTESTVAPSQLYRNNGDGTFTDIARAAGVRNDRNAKGVAWGDYDNDGDPDLYVSNMGEANRLYRNDGNGTFTDAAPDLGVARIPPEDRTFGTWFFDVNNDGWLDLYVGGYGYTAGYGLLEVGLVAADYLGAPSLVETLHIFMNDGSGHFRDASAALGVDHVRAPMGGNFGDIDNDGFLDFYLGTGGPAFDLLVPNVLYRNLGGRRFADVTTAAGVGHLQKGHGVAFGDVDNDGDQDLYTQLGGMFPGDAFASALFENLGAGNRWLTVKLRGVRANRPGIGARLRVTVEESGVARDIHLVTGSGGSFGASSLQQEIGLGRAERVREIEVLWPGSNTRQIVREPPMERFIGITEGVEGYEILKRRLLRLGGPGGTAAAAPAPAQSAGSPAGS